MLHALIAATGEPLEYGKAAGRAIALGFGAGGGAAGAGAGIGAVFNASIQSKTRQPEARAEADEIVQRARQTAEKHEREAKEQGREMIAEASERAQRDIESATKRALDDLRREVADLTIMATEKVTRKTLDDADQRRLVEEALGELDFSALSSGAQSN